jgi:hypothetical protein
MAVVTKDTLELHERARIAHARVLDRLTLAALLVADPLQPGLDAAGGLELRQRAKQDTYGMPPADRILCASKVCSECLVRCAGGGGRTGQRERVHTLVIQRTYGGVDRMCGLGAWTPAGQLDRGRVRWRGVGIVESIAKARAPVTRISEGAADLYICLPMTEVAGDNEERVG